MPNYVCAFRGRRDSYQVPLALAESEQLDQFITDAYSTRWMRLAGRLAGASVRAKIDFRTEMGIPPHRVHCLWGTTAVEHLRHTIGFVPLRTYQSLDPRFSLAAARRASKARADLFLYSAYAWEAFAARYSHTPRKVLFQYHPHPGLEDRLIAADNLLYPEVGESYFGSASGGLREEMIRRERDNWKRADLIVCASTFTMRSVVEAGGDPAKCRVVPYGAEIPSQASGRPPENEFHAVFIGSGAQRKGLHHLLLAWGQAALPPSSKLTLVCRVIDRAIERMAALTPRVVLKRGVGKDELAGLFSTSTLFIMPSLVEGFGQVYLEALSHGCPVLGTANTCLPDLGSEMDGIYLAAPGSIEELRSKLEFLSGVLPANQSIRDASRACAARFSWGRFRQTLCQYLRF